MQCCIYYMHSTISATNACKIHYLAELHNLADLKQQVMEYIVLNANDVRASSGWKEYIRPNFDLLEMLFEFTTNWGRFPTTS